MRRRAVEITRNLRPGNAPRRLEFRSVNELTHAWVHLAILSAFLATEVDVQNTQFSRPWRAVVVLGRHM